MSQNTTHTLSTAASAYALAAMKGMNWHAETVLFGNAHQLENKLCSKDSAKQTAHRQGSQTGVELDARVAQEA